MTLSSVAKNESLTLFELNEELKSTLLNQTCPRTSFVELCAKKCPVRHSLDNGSRSSKILSQLDTFEVQFLFFEQVVTILLLINTIAEVLKIW